MARLVTPQGRSTIPPLKPGSNPILNLACYSHMFRWCIASIHSYYYLIFYTSAVKDESTCAQGGCLTVVRMRVYIKTHKNELLLTLPYFWSGESDIYAYRDV